VTQAKADAEAVQRRADETETIAKADEKTARAAKEEAARATDAAAEAKQQAARDKEIAAQNLEVAHVARRDAEANAKEIQEAGERDDLLRKSFQARQRADMKEALDYLEQLKAKLEPGATSAPSSNMSAERINHFVLELGSTLSDIGDIHRQSEEFDKAIENYEAALVKLNQVLPENSKDPMLFGAYHGLAHSYQGYSRNLRPEKNKAVDYDERRKYLDKAEVFFKKALDYQVENRKDNPKEIAGGLLGLARLYSDLDNDPETVRNYRLAIDKLKESNPNEAHNALKEFAQFHRDAGRYAEAAQLYNELITSQEDITIDEFADKGQEIANVYNELADVYRADGDEKKAQLAAIRAKAKDEGRELNEAEQQLAASIQLNIQQLGRLADNGFSVADVIQRVSLKLKRNDAGAKLNLDDDLDEMGDAYVKLGKFSDAEVIYNKALDFRKEHPEKEQFIWKSYDKLATLYRENLKDDQTAAKYNDLLVNLLKDKKDSSNRYVDSIVQLAALYAKDPNRYGEAEALYQRALGIATAQDDWQYPNLILYQLGQLHLKQKRGVDREQMIRRRLEILTRYFNRLAGPAAQRPRSPNTLVTEYLNAIEAMVFITKNPADAEAVYQPASAGYTSITRAIFNPKVLESYKSTLEHYKNLLSTNGKPTETVNGQIDGLTEKLTQLNQIYTQNPAVQQGPGTYPTAP
jgi:tetratricopeptide (TPR) repeat protein